MPTTTTTPSSSSFPTPIFKLVHAANDTTQDRLFDPSTIIAIGRDHSKVSIPLPMHDSVFSRIHCKLFTIGRDVRIQDLSFNGTFVNGVRLNKNETRILASGDKICVLFSSSNNNSKTEEFTWIFYSSLDGGLTISSVSSNSNSTKKVVTVHPNEQDRIQNLLRQNTAYHQEQQQQKENENQIQTT